MENEETNKTKAPTKGMSKRQNQPNWERHKAALGGAGNMATNRGFGMVKGSMFTYKQKTLGLSTYYDKRWVLEDGMDTEPIEYHINARQ